MWLRDLKNQAMTKMPILKKFIELPMKYILDVAERQEKSYCDKNAYTQKV